MAKTSLAQNEWAKSGFKDFVIEDLVSAANSTIQNRALVSNSLKAMMGIERIPFKSINQLLTEFGPNGETVWECQSKDSRVRFVGTWNVYVNSSGTYLQADLSGSYIEVTFYGTGLNILCYPDNASTVTASLDGVQTSSNIVATTAAAALSGRNTTPNNVLAVYSGLSVGWHTAKLTRTGANGFAVFGVEIVNERSNVLVASGSAFGGMQKDYLSANTASTYNSSITGTKGGRVIKYVKDGVISEAVTMVDTTQKNMTNADHTNEEVVRRIGFREFGANRSDDFQNNSTMNGGTNSSSAFTLDDGTTTLKAVNCFVASIGSKEGLVVQTTGNYITVTFVGTGLDVEYYTKTSGSNDPLTVTVDGVAIQTATALASATVAQWSIVRIVSGLPYGTHTVTFTSTGDVAGGDAYFRDFIIYQPKKPTLPTGAIELADYNVMADYVANSTAGVDRIATGVLRKHTVRECIVLDGSGGALSWSFSGPNTNAIGGWQFETDRTGTFYYTFFGTGFELRGFGSNTQGATNCTLSLNGTTATTTNFPTMVSSAYGAWSFTASTGAFSFGAAATTFGSGLSIKSLPLGLYTIKLVNNAATSGQYMDIEAVDVITPIHSHDKGFFKVGSLALNDSRNTKPVLIAEKSIDLGKAKAWLVYDKANSKILASYNVAAIVNNSTGDFIVYFARPFKSSYYVPLMSGSSNEMWIASGAPSRLPDRCRFQTLGSSGTNLDVTANIVIFGELENEENQ